MFHIRFAIGLFLTVCFSTPGWTQNRTIVPDVAALQNALSSPGPFISITCYHPASANVNCAGGGDFDRVSFGTAPCTAGGDHDNGATILQDKVSVGITPAKNCYYRKNWGLDGVIDARQCGIYGDGSHDDTDALNTCLSLAPTDSISSPTRWATPIVNTGGGQVRIDTHDVLIPGGVTLSCGGGNAVGQVDNNNYTTAQNAIWLYNDSLTTGTHLKITGLTPTAAGAGVTGCLILRGNGSNGGPNFDYAPNMFIPGSLRGALLEASHFAGTAIIAQTESFSVTNTTILGFETCWTNNDGRGHPNIGKRVILDHVNCDGTTGFKIDGGGGGTQFDDLNVRSFLTGSGFTACTDCNAYTWDGATSPDGLISIAPVSLNGEYKVELDVAGTGFPQPQTDDIIWVRTPQNAVQSAGGQYKVGAVSSCGSTCVSFQLVHSVSSTSTNPLMGTATFTAGTNALTAVALTTLGADINKLAVGMNVSATGCLPGTAQIAAIQPDWNTIWITPVKTADCSGPNAVKIWDNAYIANDNSTVTLTAQIRSGDAYSIVGDAAGTTFNNCHASNHYTGFYAGSGSGLTRFVNCVNENDHQLEDDEILGLDCEGDCGGLDWVNGVVAQHAVGAIKVHTSSDKPVHVTNVGLGPSAGRRSGRYADVVQGTLILDNAAADSPGNVFVSSAGHLTMSGVYTPNGTLYQQDAAAFANTTGCGNTFSVPTPYSCTPSIAAPRPGGRLTLTSYSPTPPTGAVMTSDVASGTVMNYVPYASQVVPVWNGYAFAPVDIGSAGLSVNLNGSVQGSSKLYDIFAETSRNGAIELCTGPEWGALNGRTGLGAAPITKQNGVWVNAGVMTCTHLTNPFSCAVYSCTYLGTMYALTNGNATMQIGPDSASNGPALCVCLYNAYNRVPITAEGHDTHAAYTLTMLAAGWYPMNSLRQGGAADGVHASNSITVVDGLGEMSVEAQLFDLMKAGAGNPAQIGINFNVTSGAPLYIAATPATANALPYGAVLRAPPSLGLWFAQPMEYVPSANVPTYGGATGQVFSLSVDD